MIARGRKNPTPRRVFGQIACQRQETRSNLGCRQLKLFPNPATHSFTVEWPLILNGDLDLSVCDLHGRRLAQIHVPQAMNTGTKTMEIAADWPTGVLTVVVSSQHQHWQGKLVVY
jgi:hypothetical protein